MHIVIRDKKLKRALEETRECQKRFGSANARKLRLRMDALVAAESLADFWPPYSKPERCHELKGSRTGVFSMDVEHPQRLLFQKSQSDEEDEKQHDEDPEHEKERWLSIKSIEILSVEDTHG